MLNSPRVPTSQEGKAISSQNHRKFGLTGRFSVLPWEEQEEFEDLRSRLSAEHQVYSPFEAELIEKMAQHHWLSRRAMLLQEGCFDRELPVCDQEKQLTLYLRYQTTHDRAFERCASELRRLRKEREKVKIGFESHKRKDAEEARKQANENRRQGAENRKQELHQWEVMLAQAKVDHQQMLTSDVRFNQALAQHKEEDRIRANKAA